MYLETHLKEIPGAADSCKEVLPQGYLSLTGTVTHRLQELRELLDKLHPTRQEGI